MDILKQRLSTIAAGRVLDVGTGKGEFIKLLASSVKDYVEIIGIDSNERAVEAARKNLTEDKIKILEMDGTEMQFPDESFDTVCISNSLHHLPDPRRILDEMKRVLKPGGRFIICEMFCDNQSARQLNHVASHHWAAEINRILGVYHESTYEKQRILDTTSALNLSSLESFEFIYPEDEEPSEEELEEFLSYFDTLLDKVRQHEDYGRLLDEKNRFQKSIRDIGMSSATELLVIGIK